MLHRPEFSLEDKGNFAVHICTPDGIIQKTFFDVVWEFAYTNLKDEAEAYDTVLNSGFAGNPFVQVFGGVVVIDKIVLSDVLYR
jgi:hypothetical protein